MVATHELYKILKRPMITEKGVILQDIRHQYTFLVDPNANKIQIREAIEGLFKVKVTAVNTMNRRGKARRIGWKLGHKKGFKKAIVTLAEGQVIEIAS